MVASFQLGRCKPLLAARGDMPTTELSGRPRCRCRGQTRPTMPHGPLQRVVRGHLRHYDTSRQTTHPTAAIAGTLTITRNAPPAYTDARYQEFRPSRSRPSCCRYVDEN